jgi:hypothetical protein
MTENTIDLSLIATNSSGSSDNTGPGGLGVCRSEPPFKKSLTDALRDTSAPDDVARDEDDQGLPLVRQELPRDRVFGLGLDSLKEVRALADAIAEDAASVTETNSELLVSGCAFFGTPTSVNGTLASISGEEKYFNRDPKLQIQAFRDSVTVTNQATKIVAADNFLVAEHFRTGDNLPSLIESQNGISLTPLQKIQPAVINTEVQASQPQAARQATAVVSTTELATHLRVLKSSGGGEARLQLHPAELGRMTVSLTTEGSETRVSFIVDNTQARQAVEASLPRLRDLMDGAGLSLAGADVSERDSEESRSQSDAQTSEDSVGNIPDGADIFDASSVATTTQLIDAFA